ncbi:MAG TPA: DUF3048 domain-containing protein [Patescibacteria group bacterium]|nr:DUF3048 domain-containing protein [Patescibacteria group bacterium]
MNFLHSFQHQVKRFFRAFRRDKKMQVISITIFCGIFGITGITFAVLYRHDFSQQSAGVSIPSISSQLLVQRYGVEEYVWLIPKKIPRRIDGVLVKPEESNLLPVCVMIENAAFGGVRPQSGLSQAQLVYEVIVEGGITRLMAVYAGGQSNVIGPVRSARDTYIEFLSEYHCPYAHAGGSPTALTAIEAFRIRNLEGLREPNYFWRDRTKFAPHNLFTSSDNLDTAVRDHGWFTAPAPQYPMWKFSEPLPDEERPAPETPEGVQHIFIGYGDSYNVDYHYNAEKNVFERKNGNILQHDAINGEVLSATNIVIQHVGSGTTLEGKGRINWPVNGEGKVEIFHDGKVYRGTWKKENRVDRLQFYTESGKKIPLTRGNTWVEVVPEHISSSYE